MDAYVEEFQHYLIDGKNVKKNTYVSYVRDVSEFVLFADSSGIQDIGQIDSMCIESYIRSLQRMQKSNATITRKVASLRCLFQFFLLKGYLTENPLLSVHVQRDEKKLPQVLTQGEVNHLLAMPDLNTAKGCRDKAMLEVLYATGIRVSELILLNVDDVNLSVGIIHCCNGEAQRVIPMYPAAVKTLSNYLYRIRSTFLVTSEEPALFLNVNGHRLTRQGFWKIVKTYTEMAGINQDITPHTLRHSFATHLLENGAPIGDVKEMMGHADISSTQVYTKIIENKYKSTYNRYHPKA